MSLSQQQLAEAIENAHDAGDLCELASLYLSLADTYSAAGDETGMYFYLTQAYIMALDADAPVLEGVKQRLHDGGRLR